MDYLKKINAEIIGEEEILSVQRVLEGGLLSRPEGGPVVREFQNAIATWLSRRHAYATTSGTSALHVAISALGIGLGDEVIVPALANIADYSVVAQEGGKVVFADIDPKTFNIDPADVERKITPRTRAIIVVHMYGQPADLTRLRQIADAAGIALVEDCAQAAGATYDGKYVGSYGDLACFSLYQTKHIICGEGGLVVYDNDTYHEAASSVANNGIRRENLDEYDYDRIGYNYQLTEFQAAIAIEQLKKLDGRNDIRRKHVELYKEIFKDTDIEFQEVSENTTNAYFYLAALLPRQLAHHRDRFVASLQSSGILIKKLYPLALPDVEIVRGMQSETVDVPIARDICKRVFNLYVNPGLDADDIYSLGTSIRDTYNGLTP